MNHPYPLLQAPGAERRTTIGIVTPKIYPLNCYVIAGVSFAVKKLGWNCLVGADFSYINEQTVDAVVAPHWDGGEEPLLDLLGKGLPVVTVGRKYDAVPHIMSDNYSGLRDCVEHLIDQGRRNIMYLAGAPTTHNAIERCSSIEQIFCEFASQLEDTRILRTYDGAVPHDDWLEQSLPSLLEQNPGVNAIMCANDLAAITVIDLLALHGYRTPQDVAVAGFDNLAEEFGNARYKITTLHYPVYQMGIKAAEFLRDWLETRTCPSEGIRCPCLLIRRETTGWKADNKEATPSPVRGDIDSILNALVSLDESLPQQSRSCILDVFHRALDNGEGLASAFDAFILAASHAGLNPLSLHYLYLGIGREIGRWSITSQRSQTPQTFLGSLRRLLRRWLHAYHSYARDIDFRFHRQLDILERQLSLANSPVQIFETFGRWLTSRRQTHTGLSAEFVALLLFDHPVQRGRDFDGRYSIHWISAESEQLLTLEREGPLRELDMHQLTPQWRVSSNTLVCDLKGYSGTFGVLVVDLDTEFAPLALDLVRTLELKLQNSLHYELLRNRTIELEQRSLELQAASEAKTAFLAHMSHEIRTPMNGVIGMTELVLDSELQPEQRECLETALDSAHSLLDVINDILDLAKIESGHMELKNEPFALREILDQTIKAFAAPICAKGLELICWVRPDVPDRLLGDSARLRQVLVNLIGNAVKFTHGGEIVLRVQEAQAQGDTTLHFSVIDQGIGIPEAKLESIFESFEQVENNHGERTSTGLGLAISSQIVAHMGGRIWCESEFGSGATFHFTARFGAPVSHPTSNSEGQGKAGGEALLLLRSPTLRTVVCETLHRIGISCHSFNSCDDALAAIGAMVPRASAPRMLVLDSDLLAESDEAKVEEAKALCKARGIKTLLLLPANLGAERRKTLAELVEAEASAMKPLSQSELLIKAEELLRQGSEIAIPIAAGPDEPSPAPQGHPMSNDGRSILVVEDSPVNRAVATRILSRAGFGVTIAESGDAALQALSTRSFDLILMDIQMPGMDGWEVTREIRQREAASQTRTPIIALTADVVGDVEERCYQAQMDGYISKPIVRQELFQKINELLQPIHPVE